MSLGVYQISRNGRTRLSLIIRTILICQLILSICIILYCYNSTMPVLLLLKGVHKTTVILLYLIVVMHVYCMKLHYTSGLRLVTWLNQRSYWHRTEVLCKIWQFVGTMVACNGLLLFVACNTTVRTLMEQFVISLRIGISQYLTEASWKNIIDTMQIQLECCGIEEPTDWHEIPWINMDYLNEDSQKVLDIVGIDGKVLRAATPYSCCSPYVLEPCYHDPFQQSSNYNQNLLLTLHSRGCVEAVRVPLVNASIALHWLNSLVFVLQLLILLFIQLLRTSCRDAMLHGDMNADGAATLFGQHEHRVSHVARFRTSSTPRHYKRRKKMPSYTYLS